MNTTAVVNSASESRVLRNTFILLALSVGFSAIMSTVAIMFSVPFLGPWVTIGVYMALLFGVHLTSDSGLGVLFVFAITGWLGFTAGPAIGAMLAVRPEVVLSAFALATCMLVGLSGYAAYSGKDFTFMGGFLTAGIIVAFFAGLASIIFQLGTLSLLVSAAFVVLSGGLILWQVSDIVQGGETNYILATVTLFASFYNIFMSLMHLLGFSTD